jgi:hypothetical protein
MDFNGYSLSSTHTQEDIQRQGLKLYPGMRCVFYDFDVENGVSGLLHTVGVIWWDEKSKCFMLDMRKVEFQFTPGSDVSVLVVCTLTEGGAGEPVATARPRPTLGFRDNPRREGRGG